MLVILDTNIFCADFQLRGQAFRIFTESYRKTGNRCAAPLLVIDETIKAFERQLSEVGQKATKISNEWRRITGEPLVSLSLESRISAQVDQYRKAFRVSLQSAGFDSLPYPTVRHETIARRAIERRKPFREGDAGYRDTLIWETILELPDTEREVAFVSANSKDFAENGDLHPHLAAELRERQEPIRVVLFASLAAFVESILKPSLQRLETFGRDLELGQVQNFSLQHWVQTELEDVISRDEWAHGFINLNPDHISCWMCQFAPTAAPIVDDVIVLPSGAVLVAATVAVKGSVSVSPRSGAEFDREVIEFFGGDLSGDPSADYPVTGTVSFTVLLEFETHRVTSAEVDVIESDDGCVTRVNPHPKRAG